MKTKIKILMLDSGIGGLTILYDSVKEIPNADFIYFADYLMMPYGNKPINVLRKSILQTVIMLNNKYKPDVIVIACNTATSVAIGAIRRVIKDKIIIGTEPAIKVALIQNKKNILLLATPNTIKHNRLVRNYSNSMAIKLTAIVEKQLAKEIEDNLFDLKAVALKLSNDIASEDFDSIVLGCTHYIYLKKYLQVFLRQPVYDGNLGVVNQIKRNISPSTKKGNVKLITNDQKQKTKLKSAWHILNKEVQ